MSKFNQRALATEILSEVINKGASLSECLPPSLAQLSDARDQALTQEIVYGVLRHRRRLFALRDNLLEKPLKNPHSAIGLLLAVGLYQLLYLRVAAHAAVSETVNACESLSEPRARGLVNAVLRRCQREAEQLLPVIDEKLAVHFSHPEWMLTRWHTHAALPELLAANNSNAPMTLRVNRQRFSREHYQQILSEQGIESRAHALASDALVLTQACDVTRLPEFSNGAVSVQDAAAQLAADALALQPGLRVLDACCAPGGKTVHMLEREPSLQVVALDNDANRMQRVRDNLARANVQAELIIANAGATESWWNAELFDRILCDAPCSATGVIRRHPDIKWLRRDKDIAALARTQSELLARLWPTLKAGGVLVYATCSTFAAENADVVNAFLAAHSDAELLAFPGQADAPLLWQIWPGEQDMDGFFYARIGKIVG